MVTEGLIVFRSTGWKNFYADIYIYVKIKINEERMWSRYVFSNFQNQKIFSVEVKWLQYTMIPNTVA